MAKFVQNFASWCLFAAILSAAMDPGASHFAIDCKMDSRKLVAKTPFAVILKTCLVKREAYLSFKRRVKKGCGNGGE